VVLELALPTTNTVVLARAAVDATLGVAGVAGISRGRYAIARTFGATGAVIEGVQITEVDAGLHVEVHIVVALVPIPPLAAAVRAAVAGAFYQLGATVTSVDVWVDALHLTDGQEGGR